LLLIKRYEHMCRNNWAPHDLLFKSPKVIESDTHWSGNYDFLLLIHSNHYAQMKLVDFRLLMCSGVMNLLFFLVFW